MRTRYIIFLIFIFMPLVVVAQPTRHIKGRVIDESGREPLEFINVIVLGLNRGVVTDAKGAFNIDEVPPGIYRLQLSAIGYKTLITPEYIVSTKDLNLVLEMEESTVDLQEVSVTASPFRKNIESPLSLRIIGLQEIEKSPGANRDISRVIQGYPGVAFSPASYRNDLIVRGGSPSENRFFLDDVEIPNINHFATQGASGGPVGLINADLIREVNFYSGAFPASKGNVLSSVLDFKLRDGDMERRSVKATLGASEVSLASNGYLGKKTSYQVSVRQSYLQFLFKMLKLPFLPTYTDAQFKIKTRFDAHHELTILGLGGVDRLRLNDKADGEDNEYILSSLPKNEQETFTLGAVYRHYVGRNVRSVVLSQSYFNNRAIKYRDNRTDDPDYLTLNYRSVEQATKLRLENTTNLPHLKLGIGVNVDYHQYSNRTYEKAFTTVPRVYDYETYLGLMQWGVFGTISYTSPNEQFNASLGLRADAADYSSSMRDLSNQLSPRLSLSYRLTDEWTANGNMGIYYQLPPYTALGYKNQQGTLLNKHLLYQRVGQTGIGLTWQRGNEIELSVEGFYKSYDKIPLSLTDNIPLACKGNDYGVVGTEELVSSATGRSYGVEVLFKWLIAQKLNLSSSLTLFKSEYRNNELSEYIPSTWDNRYLFDLRGTYMLPKQWSIGLKVSSIGGAPYTPYDEDKSSLVQAWNARLASYLDYSRYHQERSDAYTQVDLRIDKTFYLKRCMLGFYIDIQNLTGSKYKQPDVLMSTGVIANPEAPIDEQRYVMKSIRQQSGSVIPTIGITFEF